MKLTSTNGILSVTDGEEIIFDRIYTGVRYTGKTYNTLKTYENQKWIVTKSELPKDFECGECYTAEAHDAKIVAVFTKERVFIRSEYYNSEEKIIEPEWGKDFVAFGGLYKNRIKSVKYNAVTRTNGVGTVNMQSESGTKILSDTDEVTGGTNTVFKDSQDICVDIGFVRFENYFTSVRTKGDGLVECQLNMDSGRLKAGVLEFSCRQLPKRKDTH